LKDLTKEKDLKLPDKVFIHLVVGITGHRDIIEKDKPLLKKSILELFRELKKECPYTPLLLLTPLADGADRLAAEAAIDEGIKYVVPLPLPKEEYEKDFPETVAEFENLLENKNCIASFELPISDKNLELAKHDSSERDKRYELAGAFVVKYSPVLIALWDGKEIDKTGGTSKIVGFQLKGLPEEYSTKSSSFDLSDKGILYHINTRRRSEDSSIPYKEEKGFKMPEGMDIKEKDYVFKKFNNFNEEINLLSVKKINESRNDLASPEIVSKENFISTIFAEANALALYHQKIWRRSYKFLLLPLVGVIAITFVLYTNFMATYILTIYLGFYIIAAGLFLYFHKHRERYIDFRSLAEGLRVEFFLRLAGIREDTADFYLKKHDAELQWVRETLRSANLFEPQKNPDFYSIKKEWIDEQANYFNKREYEERKKLRKLRIIVIILYSLGLLSTGFVIVLSMTHMFKPLLSLFIALTVLMPVFAGLFGTYIQRMALSEHQSEYIRMKGIYNKAIDKWKTTKEEETQIRQKIILDLAKEALRENADWLLLHRKIPDKMP
jgi:uncharacterized membrane protein HdeD (DUF308 family)